VDSINQSNKQLIKQTNNQSTNQPSIQPIKQLCIFLTNKPSTFRDYK